MFKVRSFFCIFVALLLNVVYVPSVHASYVPEPLTIEQAVNKADIVIACKITNYIVTADAGKNTPSGNKILNENFLTINPRGLYSIEVIKFLKGESDPQFDIPLPALSMLSYGFKKFDSKKGTSVLLMLKKDPKLGLLPVDEGTPFIPLGKISPKFNSDANITSVSDKVLALILQTFSDPVLREVNFRFIRDVVNPSIIPALVPYLEDPNPQVRDDVLYNLILNQQVAAIPSLTTHIRRYKDGWIERTCSSCLKSVECAGGHSLLKSTTF